MYSIKGIGLYQRKYRGIANRNIVNKINIREHVKETYLLSTVIIVNNVVATVVMIDNMMS